MIIPKVHQLTKSAEAFKILKALGYVYIRGKPRTGKTLTAMITCEYSDKINTVLIITKKKALDGWYLFIDGYPSKIKFKAINYEQLGTIVKDSKGKIIKVIFKENPNNYDLLIVDESHNFGILGKKTGRIKLVELFCKNLPHIHLSGTPTVESINTIYSQMAISKFNPFSIYKDFYAFFKTWGVPYTEKRNGIDVPKYDKCNNVEGLQMLIDKFSVTINHADAGIETEQQSEDKVHYIELLEDTKKLYNSLITSGVIDSLPCKVYNKIDDLPDVIADNKLKERLYLHQLEGGTIKLNGIGYYIGNTEKIDYIKSTFGDSNKVGIMVHFIAEKELIKEHLKNVKIYSSNGDSEGVDLSFLEHFIIYSSDYSGAKFIQRKERIVNMNGSNTNIVHHLLVKKGISEQVYKKVSKKEDFNNSTFNRVKL